MTRQTDDALVLMERALVSRDPLDLALAGFLSAYKGRTFDKQRRVIKHYADWCLQNDLPPLQAKRPHVELFVRWCETQPWSESYICQHFVGVRSFYKTRGPLRSARQRNSLHVFDRLNSNLYDLDSPISKNAAGSTPPRRRKLR